MDSPLPPDPYVALGVSKDADADAIKKAYRKLALKLHPDKCTDESQKATRTDEFTTIQQAYDIIGDEQRRGEYDAQVRLAELRRQNMEMRSAAGPRGDSTYNVRMSAPREVPRESSYSSRAPPPRPAYEAPPPRPRYYEEDYEPARGSTRKTSGADDFVHVRRAAPREERREKPRTATAPREEEKRRDAKRREAEIRESRSSKYDRDDYEEKDRRRNKDYDNLRRHADASDSYGSSTEKVYEDKLREAQKHMERQTRPSMSRREGSRQVPTASFHREASDPRRSAALPKEKERERRRENMDPYERRVPNLSTHASAPPVVESMPAPPNRAYTTGEYDSKRKKAKDVSPPPPPMRSTTQPLETMAGVPLSSKRREAKARGVPEDSGYSSPAATPGYPATHSYGEDRAAPPVSFTNGHRTVLREPSATRRREEVSPARPSKGAVKMKGLDPSAKPVKRTQYSYPASTTPIVVEPKSSSRRDRVRETERDYSLYERGRQQYFGEHGAGTTADPRYSHPTSPYEEVTYAHHPAPADVRYATGRREFEKPSIHRSSTYVY